MSTRAAALLPFLLAPLLLTACLSEAGAAAPAIALDGTGSQVWAHARRITGTAPGACERVELESPAGTFKVERTGDRFAARLPLVPGPQEIRAVCTVGERRHASPPLVLNARLPDRPTARVRLQVRDGAIHLDGGASVPSAYTDAPFTRFAWTAHRANPEALRVQGRDAPAEAWASAVGSLGTGQRRMLEAPSRDGTYQVRLTVTDDRGRQDEAGALFRVEHGRPRAVDVEHESPAWLDTAVVYGVVPFFFGERGLADVTAHLGRLSKLGVDTLWLSPIAASAEGDFGYAVTDPFKVRREFGGEAELKRLVKEAHARGMRVLLDFVPNHTSAEHAFHRAAEADGPDSPYHRFYERGADGRAEHYFDWTHLPNLDFDEAEVRRYVVEAMAHWVREFDVDGFRVDVAWGVSRRAPEFWPEVRRELTRLEPDLLLIAEAGARDPTWYASGFDVAYDWTDRLGEWAWAAAFEDPARTAGRLRAALASAPGVPEGAPVYRFLNNNDTGPRFVTRHGPKRVPAAAALLLTLPGLPGVYTGDEIGAEYEPYDEGPPIASWADPHGFTPLYQRLIRLRREHPALHGRALRFVEAAPEQVLAYVRGGSDGTPPVLVLVNPDVRPHRVALSLGEADLPEGPLVDLEQARPVPSGRAGRLDLTLPPGGFRILAPRPPT